MEQMKPYIEAGVLKDHELMEKEMAKPFLGT